VALTTIESKEEGYIGVELHSSSIIGKSGIAETVLRPSGKVSIDGFNYDALTEGSFINRGDNVKVTRHENGQLYVVPIES